MGTCNTTAYINHKYHFDVSEEDGDYTYFRNMGPGYWQELSPLQYLEARGNLEVASKRYYNPMMRTPSRVSQVIIGLQIPLASNYKCTEHLKRGLDHMGWLLPWRSTNASGGCCGISRSQYPKESQRCAQTWRLEELGSGSDAC